MCAVTRCIAVALLMTTIFGCSKDEILAPNQPVD